MRQHVNPLSSFFQVRQELPPLNRLFKYQDLPIHLDLGSARGKFLIDLSRLQPEINHLGIEIRQALVSAAERERNQLEIDNLKFLFCNANVSLYQWLSLLEEKQLDVVSIQFPDPWFKRRHRKRRILQPSLLTAIASSMPEGSKLFIQTDIQSLMESMVNLINFSECFDNCDINPDSLSRENPFPVRTERELYAIRKRLKIYRFLGLRNSRPTPSISFLEDAWLKIEH